MSRLKRFFPAAWMLMLAAGVTHSIIELISGGISYSWLAALTGCSAGLLMFAWLLFSGRARTAENLPLLHTVTALAPALILLDLLQGNDVSPWALAYAVGVAYGGTLLYLRWYSSFSRTPANSVQPGNNMPEFSLQTLAGTPMSRTDILAGKPTVLMFIRGNWCPLCTAQVTELAGQYQQLAAAGAQVIVVSSQPEKQSTQLAERFDAPLLFLVDRDNQAASALGILNKGGAPAGVEALGYSADVAYPTTLIINAEGRILYSDQTDNYRLRPEPAEFLRVLELSGGKPLPNL